jgi:hypothetical protein
MKKVLIFLMMLLFSASMFANETRLLSGVGEDPQLIIQFGPLATMGAGGSVFPTGNPDITENFILVEYGTDATFSIVPATGYEIDKVYVDDVINAQAAFYGNYTFLSIKINHSIVATFKPIMFTIIATADQNGAINPSGEVPVQYGSSPTFQVNPNQGYHLNTILVDGTPQQGETYTFTPVMANHTISATFAINTYVISASAGANGTISPAGDIVVEHGANKTFNFLPEQGYKVDKVFIDGINNPAAVLAGSCTFSNISQDFSLFVTFTKKIFAITTNFGPGGTVLPAGVDYVEYDVHSEIYVFNPDPGFIVKYVYVDGENNPLAIQNMEHRFLNIKANHNLYVVFAPASYSIFATATGGGAVNPAGLSTVPNGTNKTIYFAPEAGYELVRVIIDGINNPDAVIAGEFTFTDVSDNHNIVARFEKKMCEIFLPDPNEGAIAIPVGGSGSPVEYGNKFAFVVELLEGYTHAAITVLANGIAINPLSGVYSLNNVTVDQYITVEGLVPNAYKVTAKAYTGGAISPAGQNMVNYGEGITFEMKPNKDYAVARIVVNGIDENIAETFTMYNIKADATIEVYFLYNPLGFDELEGSIRVFSNNNVVTIINEQQIPIKFVEVIDMNGRIVWTGQATEISLNVATGIYNVRIATETNIFTTKVLIK